MADPSHGKTRGRIFFSHSCLYSLPRLLSICFKPVLTWSHLAFSVIMDSVMVAGLLVSSDIWKSAITTLYDLVFESLSCNTDENT